MDRESEQEALAEIGGCGQVSTLSSPSSSVATSSSGRGGSLSSGPFRSVALFPEPPLEVLVVAISSGVENSPR